MRHLIGYRIFKVTTSEELEVAKGREFRHGFGHLSNLPFAIHVYHSHTKPFIFRYSLKYTLRHLPNFN